MKKGDTNNRQKVYQRKHVIGNVIECERKKKSVVHTSFASLFAFSNFLSRKFFFEYFNRVLSVCVRVGVQIK